MTLTGTAILTNTKKYPFNNSVQTIALDAATDHTDYTVLTEVLSSVGEVGDLTISGKAVNGFKLAFTGSASQAVIRYQVISDHFLSDDLTMTVNRKNAGSNTLYELSGTTLSLGNGALTLDLSEFQRDDPVHLDIGEDASGKLVVGPSYRYIAEIVLPARAYAIEKGAFDDFGFPQLFKTAAPLDTTQVKLTIWTADLKSALEV